MPSCCKQVREFVDFGDDAMGYVIDFIGNPLIDPVFAALVEGFR